MYYIIETQIRPDGQVNFFNTGRSTFASALSYYHERISKMVMNDQFVSVGLLLVDKELNVIEHKIVDTQYIAAEE